MLMRRFIARYCSMRSCITVNLNSAFMLPWMMVIVASVSAAGLLATARRSLVDDLKRARVRARPHSAVMARQRAL